MALINHLIHRFDAQRPATDTNAYGENRASGYTTHITNKRCRLVIKEQKIVASETVEGAITSTYKLMVLRNTDLAQGDRISKVVADDGTTWGPFTISEVLPRRSKRTHHITCTLERTGP